MQPQPTAQRLRLASELDAAGWPSVADDVRDGIALAVILDRLRDIGEQDSDAAAIIAIIASAATP
jgi:hypothetical protein